MIDMKITNEAKSLLKLLYAIYVSRRNEGKGRVEANFFSNSDFIKENYLKRMSSEDVADLCFELANAEYISFSEGDNIANNIQLTHAALVFCEQSFQNNLKELLAWVTALKGVLPF